MLRVLFGGFLCLPVDGYSAASCGFGALTGRGGHMSYTLLSFVSGLKTGEPRAFTRGCK